MELWLIVLLSIIGFIVIALVAGFFVMTYIIFTQAYQNKEKGECNKSKFLTGPQYEPYKALIEKNLEDCKAEPCEEVTIKSFDGINLFGRVYRYNDTNRVQIHFHGYKGSGRRDMCRFLLNAKDNGMNVIIIDQRGHGRSEGSIVTYGIKERKDVVSWVNFAKQTFGEDVKVLLSGLSMGAATVVMSLDQNLPDNVKGVIADCPFSAPKDELLKVALEEKTKMPAPMALFAMKAAARIYAHFKLEEASAVESVKKAKIPVLLIHGNADNFVPYSFATKIAKANPEMVDFQTFEGAGHALSYFADTERYNKLISDFVDKTVK